MIDDFSKQMDLIKTHEFTHPIHVIGAGALGSWITFFLLKMGFNNIHVYDYDTIEEHNLPNQMFRENQIGAGKAFALVDIYSNFTLEDPNDDRLTAHNRRVTAEDATSFTGIVLCAVDSMESRKELFEALFEYSSNVSLWIEARLSLWGAYIYTIDKSVDVEKYKKTFYADSEAEVSACGVSQTALPSGTVAASTMIMQMIEWFKYGNVKNHKLEYSLPWFDCMKEDWSR